MRKNLPLPYRLKAFTLSEVLITLVIIGVVAAITIPLITPSWQKTRTVSALKKCYSSLAQTTDRAIADNGPITSWEVLDLSGREFAQQYLIPYLSVMNEKSSNKFKYTTLNKRDGTLYIYTFYLADGSKIGVGTPTESEWGISADIYVDINGDAKPNIMSKDVFRFIYWMKQNGSTSYSGKFIPYGGNWSRDAIINTGEEYGCRRDKNGGLCAALIMKDGWQISKDYPW